MNHDKFIAAARKKFGDDYEYLTEYKNQYQKLDICCVKHDHTFQQCGKQHLKAKIPCPICREEKRKGKVEQKFTKELEEKYPNLKVTNYVNGTSEKHAEATILFTECGHTAHFASGEHYILNRGDECQTCHPRLEKMREARWGESTLAERWEEIKTALEKIHDNAFGYDGVEFTGNKTDKVKILCKKHDHLFPQSLSSHEKNGEEGCPKCKKEGKAKRGLEVEMVTLKKRTKEKPWLKVLSKFLGWDKYLKVKCTKCDEVVEYNKEGEEIVDTYSRLFGGSKFGCPTCSEREQWPEEDVEKLFLHLSNKELIENYLPNRTYSSIQSKRLEVGATIIKLTGRRSWLTEEEAKERSNASKEKWKAKKMEDPVFRLIEQIRGAVRRGFYKGGWTKDARTEEIIGLSFKEFITYLTSHPDWEEEHWTLENHGDLWHIDHDDAVSHAKTKKDVIELNHYTNLKPMWATTDIAERHGVFDKVGNLNKGNRFIG